VDHLQSQWAPVGELAGIDLRPAALRNALLATGAD
jgi:hypothetical protein